MDESAEKYLLGLLAEECGEVCQMVGKAFRFGIDSPGSTKYEGRTAREMLADELGDIRAAIDFAIAHGLVSAVAVDASRRMKYKKLSNPNETDNLGRPLAPQPK